jgi:hypothetical protein
MKNSINCYSAEKMSKGEKMSFMSMEPSNQTFQEMMSNGVKYQIPRFQRDYIWKQEQWEDLWSDIETLPKEKYHYMGYIVLQRESQHDYTVIDGQQRLITLSLVILAAMKHIEKLIQTRNEADNNKERLDELRRRFIGAKNPISLRVDNKLSLNRNNDSNFRRICSKLEVPNVRGLTNTNKLINRAYEFFLKKTMGNTGQVIAEFVERVTSGMVFTKIVVQDDLNAYKVFETLNARGVQLSTPDLLKNYLFSVVTKNNEVNDNDLNKLDEDWSFVITQLGETDFTNFIRYHHNFQEKLVTKKDLFASIRRLAASSKTVYQYLDSLHKYAPVYVSLGNPDEEWWSNQDGLYREAKQYLQTLRLFNIKQPFTILMTAFFAFSPEEFVKLCQYIMVLSIRYNVICHLSPSKQETKYNQIAIKIHEKAFKRASHVKNSDLFKNLYPDDNTFFNAFEFHKMPSRQTPKKIRFILAAIESYLGNQIKENDISLEHVCPYNPHEKWINMFGEGYEEVKDRLGNMILLPKGINRDIDTKPFTQKKSVYAASGFKLAKKAASYEEWNKQSVDDFQHWMAKQATQTWKIGYE